MKKTLALLALTTALTVPALASARPVTFTVDMTRYGGDGAYVALYVTDSSGAYAGSLWMAGEKSKYYKHPKGWYQGARGDTAEVDGITGASVGAGRTLEVTLDLQDAILTRATPCRWMPRSRTCATARARSRSRSRPAAPRRAGGPTSTECPTSNPERRSVMIRILHRWPGLLAAALILVLTLSGAALSVFPALESVSTAPKAASQMTVADLAGRVQAAHPGLEQIKRAPSGRITAYWFEGGNPAAA